MANVTRTTQAEEARIAIWQHIAKHNEAAADRLILRIDDRCQLYAESPLLGDVREDLGPDIRRFHVGSYEVLYRPVKGGNMVLLVIHAARDLLSVYRDLYGNDE